MPENPPHHREIISAPERLPLHAWESLPFVAWRHGFADACDGINNLGEFEILTPEEQAICARPFAPVLKRLVGQDMPDTVSQPLIAKAEYAALNHTEAAYAFFGFPERTDVRDALLPQLKAQSSFVRGTFKIAHQQSLIKVTTEQRFLRRVGQHNARAAVTWQGETAVKQAKRSDKGEALGAAYLKAYAALADICIADIPEHSPPSALSPAQALHAYTTRYGGRMLKAPTEQTAREYIALRYQQDLQDRLFYPDPAEALSDLYNKHELRWRHAKEDGRVIATEMRVQRYLRAADTDDVYTLWVEGPNEPAAQQAASRLILERMGATNPTLLNRK